MMKNIALKALDIVGKIKDDSPISYVPPSECSKPKSQSIIPHSMVKETRDYIEKIVFQVNGCYENGWYDACAVMMRKLIETLIIECFEANNISDEIKDENSDNFQFLSVLIDKILKKKTWNLTRNTKKALKDIKKIGDLSAHNRRYISHREDIDKISFDVRVVLQELLYICKLK